MSATIAALFVQTNGAYAGLDGVELYDVHRDAMTYAGPYPVVAHPPCSRWCQMAGLVEHVHGHKAGEDGGMFAHALDCVRRFGGILEHPAYSHAWPAHDLPAPPTGGGWIRDIHGGWCCYVEQGRYGHRARKATWLYAVGTMLPSLRWGYSAARDYDALCGHATNKIAGDERRQRLKQKAASRTPDAFRDVLIAMARSVSHARRAA